MALEQTEHPDCMDCTGTGLCADCDGTGNDIVMGVYCPACDGDGTCHECDGTGIIEE
jgi:DnaJ-class molecular chaperone